MEVAAICQTGLEKRVNYKFEVEYRTFSTFLCDGKNYQELRKDNLHDFVTRSLVLTKCKPIFKPIFCSLLSDQTLVSKDSRLILE